MTFSNDVDNSQAPNSRWYSGAGIFRPLHLKLQEEQAYIDQAKVQTKRINPAVIQLEILHQGGVVSTSICLNNKEVATRPRKGRDRTILLSEIESATCFERVGELFETGRRFVCKLFGESIETGHLGCF